MSQLTEQQIEEAKRYIQKWTGCQVEENGILKLAALLQLPIEQITEEEMEAAYDAYGDSGRWRVAFDDFISRRNAKLQGKEDERVGTVAAHLTNMLPRSCEFSDILERAKTIVAALNELEAKR